MTEPSPPPPPPQWGPPPPADRSRRWLPAAIIGAAILIAGAVIAAAVLITNSNNQADDPASRSAPASGVPSDQANAADSSTCKGWAAASTTLSEIPGMPVGWNWDDPDTDTRIKNMNAAGKVAVDQFERDIAEGDPPQVVAAARGYVAAQRHSMQAFADRTYTTADGVPITTYRVKLDQVCGVS